MRALEVVVTGATNPIAGDLDRVLQQAGSVFDELRGGRVFVTGGTGFFGAWLLETFVAANDRRRLGASVVVLTRDPEGFARKVPHVAHHASVTLVRGDVRSCAFPRGTFSHVVHAATQSSAIPGEAERLAFFDTIVEGTRRTLEFARQAGVSRFLLTSSGAVYGRQPETLTHVDEHYTGGPSTVNAGHAYAEGKRTAEMLCALYAGSGLQPLIARCFAFVGPYLPLDAHFAIGNFVRDALQGQPIRVRGDGTAYRSYLYASDLAVWLWTILLRGTPLRPYNVGSEEAISIADLARLVARVLAPASPVEIAGTPATGAPVERYVPSTGRIREELGVSQTVDLEDAIARTAAWHRVRCAGDHVQI